MYLNKAKALLKEINPILEKQLLSCSKEEVRLLEAAIHHPLPLAYKEFLLWMGKGPVRILRGSDFFYREWIQNELLEWAKELLEENDITTNQLDNAFILMFHQGYYFQFIPLNQGDNPPVYDYQEGKELRLFYSSFSEYVEHFIVDYNCQLLTSIWAHSEEDLMHHNSFDDKITAVSFNKFKASEIPEKIFDFVNLTDLDLRYFGLKTVSPKIGSLTQLKSLNLNSNQLETLPEELFTLSNLETLYLSGNQLKEISTNILQLKRLKNLSLDGNCFAPEQMDWLKANLKEVDVFWGEQQ